MDKNPVFALKEFPVHLGLGATAVREPAFSGFEWYQAYGERHLSDGAEGRLVSMFSFDQPWDSWEMHPHGSEMVVCVAGRLTLHQEVDGGIRTVALNSGEAIINPPGIWHTADVDGPCTALFITAGLDTQSRSR